MENSKEIVKNEKRENDFALSVTDVSNNMFGESRTKRKTTLDLNDEQQADMFLNSMQDADFKLNDCVGKIIEVVGATITETPVESVNEETGEIVTKYKHSICLFDADGKSYVTGSGACYYSFMMIANVKGLPTKDNPLKLEVIKTDAKEKGHQYLKVKIAK